MAIELFQHMAGVRLSVVPYPGSTAAHDDILRGVPDLMFDPAPSSMPHACGARPVALATAGPTRATALPGLPIVADVLPGYEAEELSAACSYRVAARRLISPLFECRLLVGVE